MILGAIKLFGVRNFLSNLSIMLCVRIDSVEDSAEKVEGPGTQEAKESSNDSKDNDVTDVTSTLSGLLAGLPALAGPQRLANSLRQKFATNSGK